MECEPNGRPSAGFIQGNFRWQYLRLWYQSTKAPSWHRTCMQNDEKPELPTNYSFRKLKNGGGWNMMFRISSTRFSGEPAVSSRVFVGTLLCMIKLQKLNFSKGKLRQGTTSSPASVSWPCHIYIHCSSKSNPALLRSNLQQQRSNEGRGSPRLLVLQSLVATWQTL